MATSIPINQDGTINRINVDGDEYYFGLEVNPESLAKVNAATDAATKAAEKANLGESSRVDAENARVTAETSRADAEKARATAEQTRAADQLKNNTDQEQNNAAARGLTYHVCGLGEYQLDTVDKAHNVPTVDGKTGVMYLTPKVSGATIEDKYDQWMYIEYKWELMGESGVHIDPTTTDDIDSIAAGTSVTADRFINTTGLSYLWSKIKAAFAPKSHSHAATSLTGTLAISNGGTGATTAADALTNLGAAAQTDLAALRDSVSQYHPVGSVVFLANGKSPSSLGIPGTWVRTYFSIVTNKRLAFDIKDGLTGTNSANVQIYAYNGSDAQQFWFYTKNYGDVHMWVRTA